jgi:hypothetical protein
MLPIVQFFKLRDKKKHRVNTGRKKLKKTSDINLQEKHMLCEVKEGIFRKLVDYFTRFHFKNNIENGTNVTVAIFDYVLIF